MKTISHLRSFHWINTASEFREIFTCFRKTKQTNNKQSHCYQPHDWMIQVNGAELFITKSHVVVKKPNFIIPFWGVLDESWSLVFWFENGIYWFSDLIMVYIEHFQCPKYCRMPLKNHMISLIHIYIMLGIYSSYSPSPRWENLRVRDTTTLTHLSSTGPHIW